MSSLWQSELAWRPLVAYTALHGELLETVIPVLSHMQGRLGGGGGELLLGDHEVAYRLRRLGISPTPVAVFSYLDHRSILPAGHPVGPAATLSYPNTPPLDQYATPALAEH